MDYIVKGFILLLVVLIASLVLNIILAIKVYNLNNALLDEQALQPQISRNKSNDKIIYM